MNNSPQKYFEITDNIDKDDDIIDSDDDNDLDKKRMNDNLILDDISFHAGSLEVQNILTPNEHIQTDGCHWDKFWVVSIVSLCPLHHCVHCITASIASLWSLHHCGHCIAVSIVSQCPLYHCVHCITVSIMSIVKGLFIP